MTRLQEAAPPGGGIRSCAATAGASCVRPVQEDEAGAWARAEVPAASHACQAALLPDLAKVGEMRRIARAFLRRCRVSEPVAGFVVLAVSELVTNAVVHGEGEVVLHITVAVDVVRVSVTDHNPAPAVLKEAGPDGESGRGIRLVDAISDAWESNGEETWCEFRDARAAA
ncbi:ATP-binding protein [Streptomyces longwoodensis]|uniref:ATP-binding protein n=1 Tax=Streptomyces TaxID=1883 RepID=UPI00099E1B17|nr:ATP-binding protein [Streptomyces sp. TP-A0356]